MLLRTENRFRSDLFVSPVRLPFVEKNPCAHGLVLGGRCDIFVDYEVGKKSFDFGLGRNQILAVQTGSEPSQAQWDLFARQRDYLVPILNRGQVLRLTFLNAALGEKQPSLWLDVLHKGLRLKFRVVHNEFWGVPQPAAALLGTAVGFVFLAVVIGLVDTVWLAATLSLLYGLVVLVPGALLIKAWRRFRDALGG